MQPVVTSFVVVVVVVVITVVVILGVLRCADRCLAGSSVCVLL